MLQDTFIGDGRVWPDCWFFRIRRLEFRDQSRCNIQSGNMFLVCKIEYEAFRVVIIWLDLGKLQINETLFTACEGLLRGFGCVCTCSTADVLLLIFCLENFWRWLAKVEVASHTAGYGGSCNDVGGVA